MNLTANQIAFILDAIDIFEGYGDYTNSDGNYSLTEEEEVDATIEMFQIELEKNK